MMRRRGYKYTSQPQLLLRFDRFLQLHPGPEAEPLSSMMDRWAATNGTLHHAEECEKLARVFAKILRHRDPSIPMRRPDPRPRKEASKQWRTPHIYSPADVRRMLEIARNYPSPQAPLRPQSMYTMLLLAYCAGLRRGELARLASLIHDARFQARSGHLLPLAVLRGRPASLAFVSPHSD